MWTISCCESYELLTLVAGSVLLLVLRCWLRCCNLATIINIVIDHNNTPPPLLHRGGDDNFSSFHHLIINNHHTVIDTILERCHKNNIDINNHNAVIKDGINYPPLHLACQYGHLETMKVLIKHGALITTLTSNGLDLISIAAQRGHGQIVIWLCQNHIDKFGDVNKVINKKNGDTLLIYIMEEVYTLPI